MTTQMLYKAQELLADLPPQLLPEAIELLQSLRLKVNQVNKSFQHNYEEEELFAVIQRKLTEDQQQRFDYLQEQNEEGNLTEIEHCELINLVEKLENQDLERTEALIKLAQIRHVSLNQILQEFSTYKFNK